MENGTAPTPPTNGEEKSKLTKKPIPRKKIIIASSICLCVALLITSVFAVFQAAQPKNGSVKTASLSDDSIAMFRDSVKVALPENDVEDHFKEATLNANGEYTLVYSRELPDFFSEVESGDIFCVYPNQNSKENYFYNGFCGKLVQKSEEEHTVTFTVPQITEVFKKLKIDTGTAQPVYTAFHPNENVSSYSMVPLQANMLSTTKEGAINLGNTEIGFQYKENDRTAVLPDYQILCENLKIKFTQQIDDQFQMKGSVSLDYPSLKFLLDYEYNDQTDEVAVNDYAFDFVSKEKIDLTLLGKQEFEPLKHKEDILDKISPVNIVDVTESEDGKYVLGTYVLGYNVKLPDVLPISLNNTENDVGYLSLGIAFQLAVTAKGEIQISCSYQQSGFINISAKANQEPSCMVKGYDYPHPVLETTQPDGSIEQETPSITTSYKGVLSFNAGVSVDVGICILGMIPLKLANGIESELKVEFASSEDETEEVTIAKNSYIENRDNLTFSVNVYSDLKLYLGIKPKIGGKATEFSVGSVIQLFRKSLIRIPEATEFSLEQCRIGGVQLGEEYSDDQLSEAIADYATDCNDYGILSYAKDTAVNTALTKVLSGLGVQAEAFLEDLELDYPDGKIDCYSSGALFVRDQQNTVVAIVLFGDAFRNEIGLRQGLTTDEIETLYSVPDESYSAEVNVGFLLEFFSGIGIENLDLQAQAYNDPDDRCRMEILSNSGTSKLILLEMS